MLNKIHQAIRPYQIIIPIWEGIQARNRTKLARRNTSQATGRFVYLLLQSGEYFYNYNCFTYCASHKHYMVIKLSVDNVSSAGNECQVGNAISVERQNGQQIGYINRYLAAALALFFVACRHPVPARIHCLTGSQHQGYSLGVVITFNVP
jgi:hypothetical protein